jgi:membrane protein
MLRRIKKSWKLLAEAGNHLVEDNGFKLSASLSYYTIFALGPLLIVIISLAGIFFGEDAVEGKIYLQLKDVVGDNAALQIQAMITNLQQTQSTTLGAIIGGVILIIGATGVFTEMQSSINYIWSVKAKPKKGWLKYLANRLISFSLVLGLGFLLLVSLIASALLGLLRYKLQQYIPDYTLSLFSLLNTIFIFLVITALFAVIFKVLPDAIISWRDAWIGSALTAVLFLLGKYLIGLYLSRAKLDITYGTAASLVIILTWVYYSALILYYGAEFTKVFAVNAGGGIRPKQTAVFIIKQEAHEITSTRLI